MIPLNIVFTGPIGSGKTLISKSIAERFAIGWNSFGTEVKRLARSRGLQTDRSTLQELGAALVEGHSDLLIKSVIDNCSRSANAGLVIEGLRHVRIWYQLKARLQAIHTFLIYVDCSPAVRVARLMDRDKVNREQIDAIESHSTESELESLINLADLVVKNEGAVETTFSEVEAFVMRRTK